MATGRSRAYFLFTLLGQALLVALLLVLMTTRDPAATGEGLAVAWAVLAAAALAEGTAFLWTATRVGLAPRAALAPLGRSALAAGVMAVAVVAVRTGVGPEAAAGLRLAASVAVGVASYSLAAWAVNRRDLVGSLGELRQVAGAR